jgi:arsenate reductase
MSARVTFSRSRWSMSSRFTKGFGGGPPHYPAARVSHVQIFHNPSCSKSRAALEILNRHGADADVVKYLDHPPDRATLERILDASSDDPAALVRTDDKRFKELGLRTGVYTTRDAVITLLLEHPALMQRPVVFVDGEAVIARPPEKLLDLL